MVSVMGTMFDTTLDPKANFAGLTVEAVAAYANGSTANYRVAKREFPHVPVLEIDVVNDGVGDVGDFEPLDISTAHAGSWAQNRIAAGIVRPVLYFSVSQWVEIMSSLRSAGLRRRDVRIWTAHYNGRPHLCSAACGFGVKGAADATQWGSSDFAGTLPAPYLHRVIDVSLTSAHFLPGAAGGAVPSAPGPEAPPFPGRELRQPPIMSGHDVERWQTQMAHRGWRIAVDGHYTPDSEHICRLFQAEKGLPVDGVVGPDTWEAAWSAAVT
jgi:hypothetical protein